MELCDWLENKYFGSVVLGIFLDTETNGLNAQRHKIIEIAYRILDVETEQELDHYESVIRLSSDEWALTDPESLKVNGFTWERVADGKEAGSVALEIQDSFQKCGIQIGKAVFICQNPSFDRAFFSRMIPVEMQEKLQWPYHWLDLASMYWTEGMRRAREGKGRYPWETGFSKDQISSVYKLPPEAKPHRAMNGVDHLILCYEQVVGFPKKSAIL